MSIVRKKLKINPWLNEVYFRFYFKEQLLDCISSARDLIRTKLTDPQSLPGDKKMIDLIDERINQKQSKLICMLNVIDNVRKCYSSGFFC